MDYTNALGYILAALGLGLVGLRFLQSALKVQKLGARATIGFLLSFVFFLLAFATWALGIGEKGIAFLFIGAASAGSLNLVRYILLPKLPSWQALFAPSAMGIVGALFAAMESTPQFTSFFLFLMYAATLVPLFFIFHHFFVLSRDQETKTKSLGFLLFIPYMIGASFFNLVLVPLLNAPAWIAGLAMGTVGFILLSFVVIPLLAQAKETFRKTEESVNVRRRVSNKLSVPVLDFLQAF